MQKISFNVKKIVLIALMSLCMLSVFSLGVFATLRVINLEVNSPIVPNMYFSVDIQKNGTDGVWLEVFNNFDNDEETSNAEFDMDVLTINTESLGIFTSADKLYIKITNYNTTKTLNAKISDNATTIKSYKTDDTELLDGVKYIDKYVISPLTEFSKTFYCKINANFTHNVDIPIEFSLSEFLPRTDTQSVNLFYLQETELYYGLNELMFQDENFIIDSTLDFNCRLKPKSGFTLPSSIIIYIGSDVLSSDYYSYNQNTGNLTIPSGYLINEISIQCSSI